MQNKKKKKNKLSNQISYIKIINKYILTIIMYQ